MNKNTTVIMASGIAAILTVAVLAVAPNHAFASTGDVNLSVGGKGGLGGQGGQGGQAACNDKCGAEADGGHGGNANGGNAEVK